MQTRVSTLAMAFAVLVIALAGCGPGGAASSAPGSAGDPQIPSVTIRIVQAPYNDHSFASIGIAKGWYKEAGITIAPAPNGKVMTMDQVAPALIANQVDVGTMFAPIWANTLDQTSDNKVFAYADLFLGFALLGKPGAGFKTVKDFQQPGVDFATAAKASVNQIKGKTVAYPSETGPKAFRDYAMQTAGLKYSDIQGQVLDDVKIVELATGGKLDVASPTGGPQIARLLAQGWVPIVTARDFFENGDTQALQTVVGSSGLAARKSWLDANHDTALRMASVMYRIIDYKKSNPTEAAAIQLPFLNSIAGTSFTAKDALYLDQVIDPFYTFDEQAKFFADPNDPLYFKKNIGAIISQSVASGVLKKTHDASEYIVADQTWKELKSYREKTDALMTKLKAKSNLSQKATTWLDKAKSQYDARDYLDAFRSATAADMAS
jgi:ABC-type nitrate/sulfonate/bicarbonate transport system substrate-binding protein